MIFIKKNFDLIQIASIFLITIGILILSFVTKKIGLFSNSSKVNKTASVNFDKYCDYAKQTLSWLDSNRDKNGKYFLSIGCDLDAKTCGQTIPAGISGHDAMPTIWSRYNYIQKTGDKSEIDKLKRDIDFYYNQLSKLEVQNNFWNCRLLLNITDQQILSSEYLGKVHKLCLTSTNLDTDDVKGSYSKEKGFYPKVINQVSYLDWQNSQKIKNLYLQTDNQMDHKYKYFITYPSDFVARYKLSKDSEDLNIANVYFNKLLQAYYVDDSHFSDNDRCLLAISSLDLYSVNKDKKYLDWAKEVYNLYFFDQGFHPQGGNIECALLNQELAKYDDNPKYVSTNKKLMDFFISRYWDGKDSFRNVAGDGGFFLIEENFILSKDLRQNALMVNLLCP